MTAVRSCPFKSTTPVHKIRNISSLSRNLKHKRWLRIWDSFVCFQTPVPKPEVYSFRVESHIQYRYAKTVISSRLANPAKKAQEVVFSAVLPETAFISGFNMWVWLLFLLRKETVVVRHYVDKVD